MDWSQYERLSRRWCTQGRRYVSAINEYVAHGEATRWEHVGPEPKDKRQGLAADVVRVVREANAQGDVAGLRQNFPPAHAPIVEILEKKGQHVGPVVMVGEREALVVVGTAWEPRLAFLVKEGSVEAVPDVHSVGRSPDRRVLAVGRGAGIELTLGWGGEVIGMMPWPRLGGEARVAAPLAEGLPSMAESLVPSSDGERVLIVGEHGVVLVTERNARLVHPSEAMIREISSEIGEWEITTPMASGCISPDGTMWIVGSQDGDHSVLDADGTRIGTVGPQSEYPHACAFSADGRQAIFNSCHLYNGVTVGLPNDSLAGIAVEGWSDDERLVGIDGDSRVYAIAVRDDEYLLGDAFGYVRARTTKGERRWEHFLGSTITGMDISEDGKFLAVGSCSGTLHLIDLDVGARSEFTVGTALNAERGRVIFWKGEPAPLWW